MSDITLNAHTPAAPIPVAKLLPWALLAIYFVGAEQGATSMFSGTQVHEFFHDARHLLGFPCH
ncbi:CbtB-domain containing protein [Klebsiella michiganensis]|uniref:CbtB domain-containing protein n=1 Tax=Klebsiella michiganensis TaxID=1134687 RepID=UPI0013D314B4|nr:CbtB-domain containing protein [Klebsiella michiganensis]MBG2579803.1 CbtB-domain containing protein [Klebsiella michiganensis]MBG2591421.1 CbtB-domain containing protein [Klebsiella michiganensis]HAT3612108.1 CbtB-domain containing protein [Klebsiella michiganensis]